MTRRPQLALILLTLATLAAGCSDEKTAADAAPGDAGSAELGQLDTGAVQDGPGADAPVPDAAPSDAMVDAGARDVVSASDARCGLNVTSGSVACPGRVIGGEASCAAGAVVRAAPSSVGRFDVQCSAGASTAATRCLAGPQLNTVRAVSASASTIVLCPVNEIAVGGGCACDNARIVLSAPRAGGTGWRCRCSGQSTTAYAVCASKTDLACAEIRIVSGTSTRANCAAGDTLLAGGCSATSAVKEMIHVANGFVCRGTGISGAFALCLRTP